MNRRLALLVLGGLTVLGMGRLDAANILTNSFFNTDLAGWTTYPGAYTVAHDPTMGANAPGSIRFTTTATAVNSGVAQCVAVSPSTSYDVLAHFRVETGSALPNVRIQVQWFQDAACGSYVPGYPPITNTPTIAFDTWQSTSIAGLASPSNALGAMVTIVVHTPSGGVAQLWYDDVQFGPTGSLPVTLQSFAVE